MHLTPRRAEEGLFPRLLDVFYPTLTAASPSLLSTHPTEPMAYFNNINNADFYPTSPSGEFDMYPFLSRMSANEEAIIHTHDTFTNGWRMDEQPGHMIGSSTSLQVEASFGKHHRSLLIGEYLTVSLQSLHLRSPHTRSRHTTTICSPIPETAGPVPTSPPSPTATVS